MCRRDRKKFCFLLILIVVTIISLIFLMIKINLLERLINNSVTIDQTTTKVDNTNKHSIINANYSTNDYGNLIKYEDVSNYKNMDSIKIEDMLEKFNTNSTNEIIENRNLDIFLNLINGEVIKDGEVLCDLSDTKYISYVYKEYSNISFYGYVINDIKTDLYECNINSKNVSKKILYSFNNNEYENNIYVYNERLFLKDKNNNYYSLYNKDEFLESDKIFKYYVDLNFSKSGNLYYNDSNLIGNFDFMSIYYLSSNCSHASSVFIITSDNKLILSKYGMDYKLYNNKIKDIYFVDDNIKTIYLDFTNGIIEEIDFDC